ncbi:uncharacterized protein LOC135847833 [Planococcus citri]|uniref:uncharacterized protein LOC135847833 n=1 Tax=Planococcus citri TaxID=170843 RepID=UPI0031F93EF1
MKSRLFFFYITLWCFNWAAEVESMNHKALIFNQEDKQLMELRDDDESSKCTHCITACPLSSQIIKRASISGYGLLLQEVYKNAEIPKKIKTDICENPITPSIIWDPISEVFQIGYELFYKEGDVDLIDPDYDDLNSVINGEPNPHTRELINDEFITTYYEDCYSKFDITEDPDSTVTMIFYWISVLKIEIFPSGNRRHVTLSKDVINDYFHKERVIFHCENYYLSVGTEIVPLEREQVELEHSADGNRLEKTQIMPMHMLHTLSGRLASCMYANIAFIWDNVANGQLQEVDLLLYALYKKFPSHINIDFGVKGDQTDVSPELTASEHKLFRKYPIPEIMYRIVTWTDGVHVLKVVVVIHNDSKPVLEEDRVCLDKDQLRGWEDIQSPDTDTTKGTSYVCPMSERSIQKLVLIRDLTKESFSLTSFPKNDDFDWHVIFTDASKDIRAEFNRLKHLKT